MRREVAADVEAEITAPTTLEFQIAVVPHPNTEVHESLSFELDGANVQPLEISGVHGNRIHKLVVPVGNLKVQYSAAIVGRTDSAPVTEYELRCTYAPAATWRRTSSTALRQRNSAAMSIRRRC